MLEFERKCDAPVLGGPKELWENRLMEALGHNPEASVQVFNGSSGKGDDAIKPAAGVSSGTRA